jgi:UDP-GlcNAc:undecaprenyl-phosphate GlcNAc-1-phosphate transferase
MTTYLLGFASAFVAALILTPFVRRFALAIGANDLPEARKIHTAPVARMGGLAIFLAFLITVVAVLPLGRQLIGLLGGAVILSAVGVVDDIRRVRASTKLIWQVLAACVALAGGIGITSISNPFGAPFALDLWRIGVSLGSIHFHIAPIANLVSILWMVGMVNVINFLDGLDGLAAGVSAISAMVIFALAIGVGQPVVALLAIILAGSTLGFLPYNFFPAKIFMGDTGAYFLGLTIAMLAIYSGGKLATTGLVLGFTIIDAVWVVSRRIRSRVHPFTPDRQHLHHLLIDRGMSQRTAVLILYLLSATFGAVALLTSHVSKFVALVALFGMMVALISWLVRTGQTQKSV